MTLLKPTYRHINFMRYDSKSQLVELLQNVEEPGEPEQEQEQNQEQGQEQKQDQEPWEPEQDQEKN